MDLRTGASAHANAREAVAEAARAALVGCTSPALALVFATLDYSAEEVAAAVNEQLGSLPWAGCVTPAILRGRQLIHRGVAIGIIDSERVRVRVGAGGPLTTGARAAGRAAARDALTDMPLPPEDRSRAMILLTDVSAGDAAEALHGAVDIAGAGIAWSGGGVGDCGSRDGVAIRDGAEGSRGRRGAIFAKGRALRDHVVASRSTATHAWGRVSSTAGSRRARTRW